MDQPRGRSPSQQGRQNISRDPSPHPHPYPQDQIHGVDPAVQQALTSGKFNTAQQFSNPFQSFHNPQFNQTTYQDNQFGQQLDPTFANNDFMFQPQMQNEWNQNYTMDPGFAMNQQHNINPAELNKTTPEDHQSPSLLSPENHSSPGQQPQSPASTNGQFYTPQHSRHTSLDPSSAYGDYQAASFQQHRRAPSDHSDVSSATHSPYLAHADPVDASHSPFLPAQQDTNSTFGIDNFTIGEQPVPYRSPRLMPTMEGQTQGLGVSNTDMLLNQGLSMPPPPEVYTTHADPFPAHMRNQSLASDIGQADQFAPPTINIEPAPVSRQGSFGPHGEQIHGALSPPASK
jgi:transcription factor CRZ1